MPHRSWPRQRNYFALFLFAYYGFIGIFTPYASLYFSERGLSALQIGILLSLIQVTRIFGPNLWGAVADHTQQPVRVLRLTAGLSLLVFFGIFFNTSFTHFFIWMLLLNTFSSAQGPMSEALMLAHMRRDFSAYGRVRMWGSIGFIVAVGSGGELLDWFGVALMPWLAALFLMLVVIASSRVHQALPLAHPVQITPLWRLLRQRAVWCFFLSAFLMVAGHSALYVFYSLYLAQHGFSKSLIGLLWSLGVLAEIVFFFYQAPIFQRFGVRTVLLTTFLLATLRFALIGAGVESLAVLLFAQLLHAASFAAHHASSVLTLQRWFSGPLQARGQALYTSIAYGLGGSFGGLVFSLVWQSVGASAVFYLAAALAALGFCAALVCVCCQVQSTL